MDRITYAFITPMWGKAYIQNFFELSLPTTLTANNIPYLAKNARVIFIFYIKSVEKQLINSYPAMKRLNEFAQVEFREIEFVEGRSGYSILSDCHRAGLKEAIALDSYAVFLPPDLIWSNNSFRSLHELVIKGIKALHVVCLRLELEKVEPILRGLTNAEGLIDIDSSQLVALSLNCLHRITKQHFYEEYNCKLLPTNFVWRLGNDSLIAHCFHQHPLLIKPNEKILHFKGTIDDDLFIHCGYAEHEIYVVTDSDEMLPFEISSNRHNVDGLVCKKNIKAIVDWALDGTNSVHRALVRSPMLLHSKPIDYKKLSGKLYEIDNIVNKILFKIDKRERLLARGRPFLHNLVFDIIRKIYALPGALEREILGESLHLHKGHWMYLSDKKIFKPIATQIHSFSGRKLIVDDSRTLMWPYICQGIDKNTTSYVVSDEFDIFFANESNNNQFDVICLLMYSQYNRANELIEKLPLHIKQNAKIIVYADSDFVNFDSSKNISVINIQKMGGVGAMLAYTLLTRVFSKVRKTTHYTLSAPKDYAPISDKLELSVRFDLRAMLQKSMRLIIRTVKITVYPILGCIFLCFE